MKKFGILFAALFSFSVAMYAISDEAVIQLAKTMYEQGKEPRAIAQELMAQGATMEQLQRIKSTLEAQQAAGEVGEVSEDVQTDTSTETPEERKQMGETAPALPVHEGSGLYSADVFRTQGLSFEPQMNIPTPKNYRLGAGDEIIIDIYGASQLQIKKTISAEGMITLKDYGPVKLAGLTIEEATRRIKSTYGSRYQGSQLMVTLGQTRSIQINIMGEVSVPGTYQLSSFASVFHALYVAGGITNAGTLRDIKVFRNSKQIASIDLYTYLMSGKEDNIRLEDGDMIIVDQ